MHRIAITVLLAAAALLVATAASAKGPSRTVVCGKSACLTLNDRDELTYQLLDQSEPFSLRARPRPTPFYTVAFRFPGGERWNWSFLYVPSRRMIRVTSSGGLSVYWRTAPTTVIKAFQPLSAQLKPFSAPRRWR